MAGVSARGGHWLFVLAALCLGLAGCAGGGGGAPGVAPGTTAGQVAHQTATASASPAAALRPSTPTPSPTATPAATATLQPTAVAAVPAPVTPPVTLTAPATPQATATQRPPASPAPPASPSATPGAPAGAGPGGSKEAFIRQLAPLAQAEEVDSGVPAAFSIALAASETGWGASPLMKEANSYLGLTCSTPNEGLPCVTYQGAKWNAYSSPLNAFLWHGRWLRAHSQFAAAFEHTGDVAAFAREIWRCYISCGAPFPQSQYSGTMALIAEYDLEQYDTKP